MSHIVKCAVKLHDVDCLQRAIEHCNLENLGNGRHVLFNNQVAHGIAVKLPDWSYPVVINTESGEAVYDNFNGSWGKQIELDKLVQRYAIETAVQQANINGYMYTENKLENGDVELTMTQLVNA